MIAQSRSLIIGTLNFSKLVRRDEALEILRAAHENGLRAINTADTDYSGTSESIVGSFLGRLSPSERPWIMLEISGQDMGVPHDPNLSGQYLRQACERSLRRLGLDSVDRVVLPRPSFRIPLEETLSGVQTLILDAGLATSYGVSTFPAWLTCHAQHLARAEGWEPPQSELAPFNLLDRRAENEMLPNCRHWGMEFFAWAALGQGLLAGRYPAEGPLPAESRAAQLGGLYGERVSPAARHASSLFLELAADIGLRPGALAIAWLLQQNGVSGAVVGPRTPEQVGDLALASRLPISPEVIEQIDMLFPPGTATADFFNSAPWMLEQVRPTRIRRTS